MKLLDKTTIVTLKGIERRKEVEEGAKLAKKVDLLRQTVASEETKLAKFRVESLAKLKEDIDGLISQKKQIQAEITTLEIKLSSLKVILEKINKLK
jgi:chromosome segregation ATPase